MSVFICPVPNCECVFDQVNFLLSHIRNDHVTTQYQSGLLCQISDCRTLAPSYHAFRMHITRKHQSVVQFASTSTDACTIISSSTNDSPTEIPNYSAPPLNQDELNIQKFLGKIFSIFFNVERKTYFKCCYLS